MSTSHYQRISINNTDEKEEKYAHVTHNQGDESQCSTPEDGIIDDTEMALNIEHKKQDQQCIPFYSIIPYRSDYEFSAVKQFYPFWGHQQHNNDSANCKDNLVISVCVGVISLFSTITQLLFVIYAPYPYKWISLTCLLIGQIVSSVLYAMCLFQLKFFSHKINKECCLYILAIPFSSVVTPILFQIYKNPDEDKNKLFYKQRMINAPSLAVATLQSYPQTIIIAIMISVSHYNLHTYPSNINYIINCSFLVSSLSVFALCIQIGSIFKQHSEFLATSLWLLFDFIMTLTIALLISYDSITLLIFYIDIALYNIWLLILITLMSILFAKQYWQWTKNYHYAIFWVFCCGAVAILLLAVVYYTIAMMITMYFYSFTFVWFVVMDQLYGWNICPMGFRCIGKKSNRYTLYEWIQEGESIQERNDRLYSINMVILDHDNTLRKQYKPLCHQIVKNIQSSIQSSDLNMDSLHEMTSVIDRFSVLTYQFNNEWNVMWQLEESCDILKWLMLYFPINRILHFILPFVIILYIIFSDIYAPLDTILQVLFSLLLILLVMSSIMFYISWKLWNYHRLILPINYNENGINMNWYRFATQI
eukprot:57521_1